MGKETVHDFYLDIQNCCRSFFISEITSFPLVSSPFAGRASLAFLLGQVFWKHSLMVSLCLQCFYLALLPVGYLCCVWSSGSAVFSSLPSDLHGF